MGHLVRLALVSFAISSTVFWSAAAQSFHPTTGEVLAEDQSFQYSIVQEPTSFDPQYVESQAGSEIARDLFEGLFNQDSDGSLVPGVATHFEVSADNRVFTFFLRREAKWSDGNPVTANDFVYAWRRLADPEIASPYSWMIEIMALENGSKVLAGELPIQALGVAALDDRTFQVSLADALPYFPLITTHSSTFPTPAWVIDAFGTEWTRPENIVSNGAYKLTQHIADRGSVREQNPHYWNNRATIIEAVTTYVVNDDDEALRYFMSGQLDRTAVPSGKFAALQATNPDETKTFPRNCVYYYVFNLSMLGPLAFKDERVRQALSYAIDRRLVIDEVLQAGQTPAFTFTPDSVARFTAPDVEYAKISQVDRDRKARELMQSAGYSLDNPLSFTLVYNTSVGHTKIANTIAEIWHQTLGVDVKLTEVDWKEFLETRGNQNFDIARAGWCGDYNEASTFLDLMRSGSPYNDGKYANDEVDRLMESSKSTSDTNAVYTAVERILANEMPIIPIYHYSGTMMLSTSIKNWPLNNVEHVWYSKDLYRVED
jgi:oligopeptide transport system substrate-binding protein